MDRKTKMKIGYFIKENKTETSTLHQHGILTKNSEKRTSKHKSHRTEQEKRTK